MTKDSSTRSLRFHFQETVLPSSIGLNRYFQVHKEVANTANLMDVVLDIYKALPREFQGFSWSNSDRPDTIAIQFVGHSGEIETSSSPRYELNSDGSILFLPPYAEIGRGWSMNDVEILSENQLIDFNGRDIVVRYPQGLGSAGGFEPILDWLINFGIDFAAAGLLDQIIKSGFRKFRRHQNKVQIQKIAESWAANNLRYPSQLRDLVDTRSKWDLGQLAGFLKIDSHNARQLLKALGYKKTDSETYSVSTSMKALKKRQKWMLAEQKYFLSSK